jgi:NAD(P)H-hydrate epimerase
MEKITDLPKMPARAADAHKGIFGKVLVVAGSIGMSGAAAIAAKSALRSGAGVVNLAIPKIILPIVAGIEPSYVTVPLAEDRNGKISSKATRDILNHAEQSSCVAFGPGVGTSNALQSIAITLISQQDLRLVIDADGLNNLAKDNSWPGRKQASVILTPHPGEFKKLWKSLIRQQMPADRTEQAVMLAERTGCVVVLKGAGTVVTDGSKVYVNTTGNPGMATAGAGDVLTGVISALVGQGLSDFNGAAMGVYVHGLAGDIAAEKFGQTSLIATDIIEALPEAFRTINNY